MWKEFALATMVASATARADKVDDFKEAVNNRGCKSIPYSDLRSNCESEQSNVHDYCDGDRGPTSCVKGETGRLKRAVETEQKALDSLREKRRDVDSKRSGAPDDQTRDDLKRQMEDLDRQIDDQNKRLRQAQDAFDKRKDFVDKAIDTIGRCINYRRSVLNVFGYATDKVRGEDDPVIRPYAQQLRERWIASRTTHEQQVDERSTSERDCESERP